ncbi:MAG: hypothetical protein GY716_12205 [bacterium]|nr:hypothetical protein [bacterium]
MTTISASPSRASLVGRTFSHPAFDYLLIGGGISLLVTLIVVLHPAGSGIVGIETLPLFFLAANAAHFAASTVRLYTKPDAYRSLPFLTMAFPLVSLLVLTAGMFWAGQLGPHLRSLYLTWSPYHYAAQAYGLAVMYTYRSGCKLADGDKKLLRGVALLPFLHNFVTAPEVGLDWLLPQSVLDSGGVALARGSVYWALLVLALASPVWLFIRVWRSASGPMPLIAMLTVVTNGVWFFVLSPLDAFIYATIFHSVQYLAIVIIFHLKDQKARPDNRHGALYHVLWFYGMSLALGYALFYCLPLAYVFAGFGRVESMLLVVAAINLHHFIVDGYIWRLGRGDANRHVVDSGPTR